MADSKSKRARIESVDATEAGLSVPLSMALAMTDWQQTAETVEERDNYLLDNNMFTDVKFIVGEEGEEISCHRLYLAKTSPTFASMLYGELSKNNESEIKIPDVSPDAFKALLKYVYSGTLKLKSYYLAWEVLYAAKKYLMPDALLSLVRDYIQKEVSHETRYDKTVVDVKIVWPTIQLANDGAEDYLLEATWECAEKHMSELLKHDTFVDVSPAILETLVKKDNLNCTEVELFQACIKWAKHEAMKQEKDPEPQNLKEILQPILSQIRFLAFNTNNFLDGPAKLGLLTESEVESFLNYKITKEVPPTICKIDTPRKYKSPDHFYVIGEPKSDCSNCKRGNKEDNLPEFTYKKYASNSFENTQNIIGFKIPSQIKTGNISKNNNTYLENFTVYFYEHEKRKDYYGHPYSEEIEEDDIQEVHFKSVVKYNSNIIVKFQPEAFSYEICDYGYGIIFHKSGCYPTQPIVSNAYDCKFNSDNEMESGSDEDDEATDELECGFMTILLEK